MSGEWPGFVAPTPGAVAVATTAFCVAVLAWRRRRGAIGSPRVVWSGLAGVLALVATAETLNVELLAGAVVRCALLHEALYADRGPLQLGGMLALALGAPLAAVVATRSLPASVRALGLPLAAAAALLLFLGWRALSLHNFDSLVQSHVFGLTLNRLVELALLLLLLYAVARTPEQNPS